jgi:ADP-ribose pyrophosphatase
MLAQEKDMSKDRTVKATLLNMCMIYDKANNLVLVQDKIKDEDGWGGYTFPGGHIENGESFITSVIREVKEETGLDIADVTPCGLVDWYNEDEPERYLVFLYRTSSYTGTLIEETEEGKIFWMELDKFMTAKKAPNMDTYLKMFLEDNTNEAYATWGKNGNSELIIK